MWKTCEKCPIFTLFSHVFHTFFTHFSHAFHTHISHACEILHSEIYVKRVWSDVIPFTHIFTYTSHGVSHRLSHVNPHLNSHIFSYTSHGVSHGLSHVLNPHWMAKHLEFHMLLIHTLFSHTLHMSFHMWQQNFTTLRAEVCLNVNKPTTWQTSHPNDFVNAKSHAREKTPLAG